MAEPPSSAGADQVSATSPSPGAAERFCGTDGTSLGVARTIAAGPSPGVLPLTARTSKLCSAPLVRPETVCVVAVPTEVHAVLAGTLAPAAWRIS